MKKLLFAFSALLFLYGCINKGYEIKGFVPGAPDGTQVKLEIIDTYPATKLAEGVVANGEFVIRNEQELECPLYVRVVLGSDISSDRPGIDTKAYRFFLDNGQMKLECLYDSLPSYYYEPHSKEHNVKFSGSAPQEHYNSYQASVRDLTTESARLNEEYLEKYHKPVLDNIFNTGKGMAIIRERSVVRKSIVDVGLEFVRQNSTSPAAILVGESIVRSMRHKWTPKEFDDFLALFDKSLQDLPLYVRMKTSIDEQKDVAYGVKYFDIEVKDRDGKKVMLSEFVEPGKYNMLEFWASWCGPCRGEIPHLRHLRTLVPAEKFNMLSISLDERDADWQKAMEEEGMGWVQLCDDQGYEGVVRKKYHIHGIPDCLILDPDGCIVGGSVRGAELDVLLEDLLGKGYF